ncbi:G protein-coupled receptor 155 [Aureococcus anophagefferens]|nr:G protein-coupled receptor 155 [Aureococcus anophagefferens]
MASENPLVVLLHALVVIALVHALGFWFKWSGRLDASVEKGLSAFLFNVSLPALLFKSIATMRFGSINGRIFVGVLLAKALLAAVCRVVARCVYGPSAMGAVAGLFATNSDDLALGLPCFTALFGAEKAQLLCALCATQSLTLNPALFVALGVGARAEPATKARRWRRLLAVARSTARGLLANPLVLGVAVGLFYNGAFRLQAAARGRPAPPALPTILDDFVAVLGAAFTPCVLFVAGASIVDSYAFAFGGGARATESDDGASALRRVASPLALVIIKIVALPLAARFIVEALGASVAAQDYVFLYGVLPTANAVLAIVRGVGVDGPAEQLVATALLLCKPLSFVALFGCAALVSARDDVQDVLATAASTLAVFSVGAGCWVLFGRAVVHARGGRSSRAFRDAHIAAALAILHGSTYLAVAATSTRSFVEGRGGGCGRRRALFTVVSVPRWACDAFLERTYAALYAAGAAVVALCLRPIFLDAGGDRRTGDTLRIGSLLVVALLRFVAGASLMTSVLHEASLGRTSAFLYLFFAVLGHGQGICVALLFGFAPDVLEALAALGGVLPSLRAVTTRTRISRSRAGTSARRRTCCSGALARRRALRASIVELRNSVSPRVPRTDSDASLDSLEDAARRSEIAAGNLLPLW